MVDASRITKQDILDAIKEIDAEKAEGKWNKHNDPITHFIIVNGKEYPIKNPIERAYKKIYGADIYSQNNDSFTTRQAKPIMERLGFEVIVKNITKILGQDVGGDNYVPDLNVILYGPPGTGKTFVTKQKSVNRILGLQNGGSYPSAHDLSELELIHKIRARLESEVHGRVHPRPGATQSYSLWIKNLKNNIGYGIDISKNGDISIYVQSYSQNKDETKRNTEFLINNTPKIEDILGLKFLRRVEEGQNDAFYYDYQTNYQDVNEEIIEHIVEQLKRLDAYIKTINF